MAGPARRSARRSRSKSPPEKKVASSRRSSGAARKFKKAPSPRTREPSDSSESASMDDENYDGGDDRYNRQSTSTRTAKNHSCVSCCDGIHSCHHHHISISPPPKQDPVPVAAPQQYQPMNVQPLHQRAIGQPTIHHGVNGQPSVIVVPTASNQSAPPRPPSVGHNDKFF